MAAAYAGAFTPVHEPSAQEAWPPVPALVENINVSTAPSNPTELIAAGDALFFVADDGIHGSDLWITDGTGTGTRTVRDFQPGAILVYADALDCHRQRGLCRL